MSLVPDHDIKALRAREKESTTETPTMIPYHRLQQFAIAISIASILYNGAEGGISIGFGAEDGSRSLVFFGIQSGIEVASAIIVVWRFRHIAKPGEEAAATISASDLR